MDNTQNIISFCTGYGGIELGIKRTGLPVRTVCYVEIEHFCQANLVAKIEQGKMDAAPIWSNLKTFDGKPFRGKVHGLIGGYPCQPFSNAGVMHGHRKGTEDPRHLWPYMGRTVDGFASRVDELRLLGNGVVPQTAELAFRTLWSKV